MTLLYCYTLVDFTVSYLCSSVVMHCCHVLRGPSFANAGPGTDLPARGPPIPHGETMLFYCSLSCTRQKSTSRLW